MMKSSGPGVFIPHVPITVDYWHSKVDKRGVYHFCTHAHSDHVQGLHPSWSRPIYCSAITAKLLTARYGLREDLLVMLELNSPTMMGNFSVTCLDANHCPGSVMFLFQGHFGTILHTGDFRYNAALHPGLHPALRGEQQVDMLYLDNTYCNRNCVFPSRDVAAEEVIELVRSADPNQQRVHIVTYNIGKEDLLVRVAKALNLRIVVSKARMEVLRLLEICDVFTTSEKSHIHSLTVSEAGNVAERLQSDWRDDIVIHPTALLNIKPQARSHMRVDGVHVVAYSDHSSYAELHEFVASVKPLHIRGTLAAELHGTQDYYSCRSLLSVCNAKDGALWVPVARAQSSAPPSPKSIAASFGFKRKSITRKPFKLPPAKRLFYDDDDDNDMGSEVARPLRLSDSDSSTVNDDTVTDHDSGGGGGSVAGDGQDEHSAMRGTVPVMAEDGGSDAAHDVAKGSSLRRVKNKLMRMPSFRPLAALLPSTAEKVGPHRRTSFEDISTAREATSATELIRSMSDGGRHYATARQPAITQFYLPKSASASAVCAEAAERSESRSRGPSVSRRLALKPLQLIQLRRGYKTLEGDDGGNEKRQPEKDTLGMGRHSALIEECAAGSQPTSAASRHTAGSDYRARASTAVRSAPSTAPSSPVSHAERMIGGHVRAERSKSACLELSDTSKRTTDLTSRRGTPVRRLLSTRRYSKLDMKGYTSCGVP